MRVEFKNDIVLFTCWVSLAYLRADQQLYWWTRAELIQALASLILPSGRAFAVDEIRYSELCKSSRQFFAAVVLFLFPADESRIDFTIDCAVLRFSEETQMADWMIWTGLGFGGT